MPLEPRFLRLADKFLDFIKEQTGFNTIVCDETGTIVRASIRTRIGNSHAGALRILRNEADEIAITSEDEAKNPLTKEGLNCPIVIDGRRVATFGVSGSLSVTRPVARIASVVLATWLKEMEQESVLRDAAASVFKGIDDLAARVDRSAGSARKIAEGMASAATEAVEKVQRAEAVVSTVQRIAQQSRILSINGSVEATRAGDHGRAFAVVAKDMTRLAEETKATSAAIQKTLSEIGRAIGHVQDAVARSTSAATDQGKTLGEVTRTVAALKEAMAGLENTFGIQQTAHSAPARKVAV